MDLRQQGSSRAEHPAKDTDTQDTRPYLSPLLACGLNNTSLLPEQWSHAESQQPMMFKNDSSAASPWLASPWLALSALHSDSENPAIKVFVPRVSSSPECKRANTAMWQT